MEIEACVRYLTTIDGGRKTPVANGYRGQFHYEHNDKVWDAIQTFPDGIEPGRMIKSIIWFPDESWNNHHIDHVYVGMRFEIREGRKIVARGLVTGIND